MATTRFARIVGTSATILALAVGAAACEGDDAETSDEGQVEEIVEDEADNADELGTETESPNTGDDVGDESPGEG